VEERLRVSVLLALLTVVRTAVHLTPVSRLHPEMIRDVDTIVHQFHLDVTIKEFEVDTLLQRLVACRIEDIVDHLVEQRFLIDIAVTHNLLQRLRGLRDAVLVSTQNHRLGHTSRLDGKGLQLEA